MTTLEWCVCHLVLFCSSCAEHGTNCPKLGAGWSMGDCKNDRDCQDKFGENLICSQNLCACGNGYIFDFNLVRRGCYRKAKLFDHCVTKEQCTAMNRNTYCNPSNQCTCSAGYYFDGRECILRYDTNLKAQEVYRAAVVAAACFIVAVVGIFVACIVRRTFCRREQHGQGSDSSRNSDIFSISDEIAALRAVDKPPSYEEVLQIERTFYGIPPPEYSFVRSNNMQNSQEPMPIPVPEVENMPSQETPVDVHIISPPEFFENSESAGTSVSPSLKTCQLCANVETLTTPCSSAIPDLVEAPETFLSATPSLPKNLYSSFQANDNPSSDASLPLNSHILSSLNPNAAEFPGSTAQISKSGFLLTHGQEAICPLHSSTTEPSTSALLPHFNCLTHSNSTWPRSSLHSISSHIASPPMTPPWPLQSHLRYSTFTPSGPLNPKTLMHTSSLPPSSVHPPLDYCQSALPVETSEYCSLKENKHVVKSCSQETLIDGHTSDASAVAYDNAAYVTDPLK